MHHPLLAKNLEYPNHHIRYEIRVKVVLEKLRYASAKPYMALQDKRVMDIVKHYYKPENY